MYDLNLDELKAIFQGDTELLSYMDTWDGDIAKVYARCLPAFEAFLVKVPDAITVFELEAVLLKQSIDFRLLFAVRISQMFDRLEAGKVSLRCESLGGFLQRELYENHPEKINRLF